MYDHAVFGGCLRSEIPFPELERLSDASLPNWTLRVVDALAPLTEPRPLGEDVVYGECRVRSFRDFDRFRLVFDDTGTFDVSGDGARIEWLPGEGDVEAAARADVIGRVLAMALYAHGTLSLHASAVAIGGRGVAFLAPKFHGKSTLAMALVSAGGRLLSDDTLPIDPGPPAMLWPGVHRVRLWEDSARRLRAPVSREDGAKHLVDSLPREQLQAERVPVDAAYLLVPVKPVAGQSATRRVRLTPVRSALSMVVHAKLAPLLGKEESANLLDHAVAVSMSTPIYELAVARDLDRISEVVDQLLAWHDPSALGAAGVT